MKCDKNYFSVVMWVVVNELVSYEVGVYDYFELLVKFYKDLDF